VPQQPTTAGPSMRARPTILPTWTPSSPTPTGKTAPARSLGAAFYNPTTLQFPPEYEDDYFFADFCGGWIRRLEQTPDGEFSASTFATGLERPIDLEVSKAGEHYTI
jgi:glucose/arabinose dehydrogenase